LKTGEMRVGLPTSAVSFKRTRESSSVPKAPCRRKLDFRLRGNDDGVKGKARKGSPHLRHDAAA
jgi:hypothetical protein